MNPLSPTPPLPPRRRVRVDIRAHADDRAALSRVLYDIADRLSDNDFDLDVVSTEDSKHAGFTLRLLVDDTMNPRRYRDEQCAWWEATAAAQSHADGAAPDGPVSA